METDRIFEFNDMKNYSYFDALFDFRLKLGFKEKSGEISEIWDPKTST